MMDRLALIGCVVVLVTIYCSDVNGQGSTTFTFQNFGTFIAPQNGVLTVVENSTVAPPTLSVDVDCRFEALPSDYSPRSTADTTSLWSRDGSPIMNMNGAGNALNVTTTVTSLSRTVRTASNLVFPRAVTVDLAGNYTCTVTSRTIYFVLHVAVKARIENAFEDVNVTRGNPVSLPCNSSGTVPVIKVWYKDGVVLQNTTTTTFSDDSPLRLSGDRSDTATYTCSVTNQFGNQSSTVGVTVQEAPYFTAVTAPSGGFPTKRTFPVILQPFNNGNSLILSYTVVCRPQAPRYTGLANVSMSDSTLTFEVTGLQPGATYNCAYFATNSIGNGSESSSAPFNLLPDVPGSPMITDIFNTTSTSLNVTYRPPGIAEQNGDPTGYTLSYDYLDCNTPDGRCPCENYHCSLNGSTTISSGVAGGYLLMGLRRYTTYNVSLQTINAAGIGIAGSMTITTAEDRPGPPKVSAASTSSTNIRIDWISPREPNGIISGYILKYSMAESGAATPRDISASSLTYNITDGVPNTLYTITVAARNSVGVGTFNARNESTDGPPQVNTSTTLYRFDAFQSGDLPCDVIQGQPTPVVTWTTPSVGMWATGGNGALQFRPTPINATGTYSCTASNKYGSVNHTVTLQVVSNATITTAIIVNSTDLTGEGLYMLNCTATASHLISSDVEWVGKAVQLLGSVVSNLPHGVVEVVHTALVPGNDTYFCKVRSLDTVSQSVNVQWVPSLVATFTSPLVSCQSWTLLCRATGSPYPRMRIYQDNNLLSSVRQTLNGDTVEADITVLSGGTFRCVADNRAGESHQTIMISESMDLASPEHVYILITLVEMAGFLLLFLLGYTLRRAWRRRVASQKTPSTDVNLANKDPVFARVDFRARGNAEACIRNRNEGADSESLQDEVRLHTFTGEQNISTYITVSDADIASETFTDHTTASEMADHGDNSVYLDLRDDGNDAEEDGSVSKAYTEPDRGHHNPRTGIKAADGTSGETSYANTANADPTHVEDNVYLDVIVAQTAPEEPKDVAGEPKDGVGEPKDGVGEYEVTEKRAGTTLIQAKDRNPSSVNHAHPDGKLRVNIKDTGIASRESIDVRQTYTEAIRVDSNAYMYLTGAYGDKGEVGDNSQAYMDLRCLDDGAYMHLKPADRYSGDGEGVSSAYSQLGKADSSVYMSIAGENAPNDVLTQEEKTSADPKKATRASPGSGRKNEAEEAPDFSKTVLDQLC